MASQGSPDSASAAFACMNSAGGMAAIAFNAVSM